MDKSITLLLPHVHGVIICIMHTNENKLKFIYILCTVATSERYMYSHTVKPIIMVTLGPESAGCYIEMAVLLRYVQVR